MADKNLHDVFRLALPLYEMSSMQRSSVHTRDRERTSTDEGIAEPVFRKYWVDMSARIDRIQTSLDAEA